MPRTATAAATLALIVLAAALLLLAHAPARAGGTLTVTSVGDADDTSPGDGICDSDAGAAGDQCTLRAAITEANTLAGENSILFSIPGPGPHTISPASALPPITGTLTINGTFEPDYAGTPIIELDGSNAGPDADGLRVQTDLVNITGLVINRFGQDGVYVGPGDRNFIFGNYIGTDVTGTLDLGNGDDGVQVTGGAANAIGGSDPGERNVISGNDAYGIFIAGTGVLTTGTIVQGNYIGTDATGMLPLGNAVDGVGIQSSPANIIGVDAGNEGIGNVISANMWGVAISGPTSVQNLVQGNLIGLAADGESPLGNSKDGVILVDGAPDNTIGGHTFQKQNEIAFNGEDAVAVAVDGGVDNYIDPNQIHDNGGLGTDILEDGVTPNDLNDVDEGPNDIQNFPLITGAAGTGGASITILGTLNSTPNRAYNLFFFYNRECDPSGYGEGEVYIGKAVVVTDVTGNVSFSKTFDVSVPGGSFLTTTASNPLSTSEFSPCFETAVNGDIDCDTDIDTVDALKILRHVAGLTVSQTEPCPDLGVLVNDRTFGDADCDDDIDAVDALALLRHVAGLPPLSTPPGCLPIG